MSITAKIEKLLALAADAAASDNEREQAIKMAATLMENHKISQSDLYANKKVSIKIVTGVLWEGANDHMLHQDYILGHCCEAMFDIKTYAQQRIIIADDKAVRRSQLMAIGEEADIASAIKFFIFIRSYMLLASKGMGYSQKQLHEFRRGFANALYRRIVVMKRDCVSATKSDPGFTQQQSSAIELYNSDKQKAVRDEFSKIDTKQKHSKEEPLTASYAKGARAAQQVPLDGDKPALEA